MPSYIFSIGYIHIIETKTWLQFIFVVLAAAFKQQISKFCPQIQRTEALRTQAQLLLHIKVNKVVSDEVDQLKTNKTREMCAIVSTCSPTPGECVPEG